MAIQRDRQACPRFTPDEYLSLERSADFKSEYLSGEMVAMSGASREHNLITVNVPSLFNRQLAERPCENYASDMRVRMSVLGDYVYPDVVVVCGEPQFEDAELDTLLNPTVIVEVLSPSTENYDRGTKFALYRQIELLTDYILIAQDAPHIEHHARQGAHQWLLTEITGLQSTLHLPYVGCVLRLSDIYNKVAFVEKTEL